MNTRTEELRALVEDAWDATAALEHQPEDRSSAFRIVLEAALRNNGADSPRPVDQRGEIGAPPESDCDTAEFRTNALATALAIKREQVADLFNVASAEPTLTPFAARRLAHDCGAATRELTLLICVARNALGLNTGTWLLRDLAGSHERLDLKGFQATLDSMDEIFVRGEPNAEDRGITLRLLGFDAAREIAQRILA